LGDRTCSFVTPDGAGMRLERAWHYEKQCNRNAQSAATRNAQLLAATDPWQNYV
jgi:hypothetical protein